jgi:K+-sensing histidine kinase KdpD
VQTLSSQSRKAGALIGVGGIALITGLFYFVFDGVAAEVPALLLLVPITAASVLSDWRIGLPVALLAAATYAFVILPPFGAIRIGYTQDVVITITFVAVAIVVSVLVSRRSIASQAELIGTERMLLLRTVSHDLRNPLNTIRAASTDLLGGHVYDDATRDKLLTLVVEEAERMDRIVANLLSLSRMQAGALAPAMRPESIHELIDQCRIRLGRVGEHAITVHADDSLPDVLADATQIDQVLTNLIENSLRHSSVTARIDVTAAVDGAMVRVDVDDDGPGFSDAARERMFHPFRSAAGSSGLGLTVCKAIVEAHGGNITIGDNPTGGARVSFTLPIAG